MWEYLNFTQVNMHNVHEQYAAKKLKMNQVFNNTVHDDIQDALHSHKEKAQA